MGEKYILYIPSPPFWESGFKTPLNSISAKKVFSRPDLRLWVIRALHRYWFTKHETHSHNSNEMTKKKKSFVFCFEITVVASNAPEGKQNYLRKRSKKREREIKKSLLCEKEKCLQRKNKWLLYFIESVLVCSVFL